MRTGPQRSAWWRAWASGLPSGGLLGTQSRDEKPDQVAGLSGYAWTATAPRPAAIPPPSPARSTCACPTTSPTPPGTRSAKRSTPASGTSPSACRPPGRPASRGGSQTRSSPSRYSRPAAAGQYVDIWSHGTWTYGRPAGVRQLAPRRWALSQAVGQGAGRTQELQLDNRACRDDARGEVVRPRLSQLVLQDPEHAGGVDQVEGRAHRR